MSITPADMVRMMEMLWAEGYQLEFTPSASLKNHICIIQKEHYYSSTSRENCREYRITDLDLAENYFQFCDLHHKNTP